MASEDETLARDLYEAALSVAPDLIVMVLSATAQQNAAQSLGCKWAGEIFADRAYNDNATLVDRSQPGAVIHDAALAGQRMVKMVQAGAIITESGKEIPAAIDTICLHGDTPEAVDIARSVKAALQEAGIALKCFEGRTGA
jgi:5-oxoprolinase (ATP-hydrolysing) subunit A